MKSILDIFFIFLVSACITKSQNQRELSSEWNESKHTSEIDCHKLDLKSYLRVEYANRNLSKIVLLDRSEKKHAINLNYKKAPDLDELPTDSIPFLKNELLVLLDKDNAITTFHEDAENQYLVLRSKNQVLERLKVSSDLEFIQSSIGLSYFLHPSFRSISVPVKNKGLKLQEFNFDQEVALDPIVFADAGVIQGFYVSNTSRPKIYFFQQGGANKSMDLNKEAKFFEVFKTNDSFHIFLKFGNPFEGTSLLKYIVFENNTWQVKNELLVGDVETSIPFFVDEQSEPYFLFFHSLHKNQLLIKYRITEPEGVLKSKKIGVLADESMRPVGLPIRESTFLAEQEDGLSVKYFTCNYSD